MPNFVIDTILLEIGLCVVQVRGDHARNFESNLPRARPI